MTVSQVMYSSNTDQWETPQDFYDDLNKEFSFNLDPCADEDNHKCELYFTKEQDGLSQNWGGIEFFAILRMAARLANGLKKHIWRVRRMIHLL